MSDPVGAVLAAQVAAWNEGDIDGFCAHFAEDAVWVSAGDVIVGRDAIAAAYRARYPDRAAMGALRLAPLVTRVRAGSAVATVRWSVGSAGGVAMVVLAPDPDGVWRMTGDATFRAG